MDTPQNLIFAAFQRNINAKICPYLLKFHFNVDNPFNTHEQGITAAFTKNKTVLNFSLSLHHLDYADGIIITLRSAAGNRNLLSEVQKMSSKKVSAYLYGTEVIDLEFDRILTDIKTHFSKYLVV